MTETTPLPDQLSDLIAGEIANALGLSRTGAHMRFIGPIVRRVTRRFGQLATGFDADIEALGFREGARRFAAHFVEEVEVAGAEAVPTTGPLIVAANHPGVTDALILLAGLPMDDARLVISDVPITRALPHASDRFIHVSGEIDNRVHALREMTRHLRDGGAIVIFPSTHLTPDPALTRGATGGGRTPASDDGAARSTCDGLVHATFDGWSPSILLPLRRVPDCRLQAAIVSGVRVPRFSRHPLIHLIRDPTSWKRQRLSEFLQVIHQIRTRERFGLVPHVSFGEPIAGADLNDLDREAAMAAVRSRSAVLLHTAG